MKNEPLTDELTEFEQNIIGKVCRIEIPLKSPSALLQVAELLRGLASECEWAATNRDLQPRTRLYQLASYAREVNRRFKLLRGRGRPPKSVNQVSRF